MRISDLIKMGLKNLSRRKARTTLTVIGVIIGTISIVVMVSIGIGMNASFESQIMQQGSLTEISVESDSWEYDAANNTDTHTQQTLNSRFVDMVKQIDHVNAVTPYLYQYVRLTSGKYETGCRICAIDTSVMDKLAFPKIIAGSAPTDTNKNVFIFGSAVLNDFSNMNNWRDRKTVDPATDRIRLTFQAWQYTLQEGKKQYQTPVKNYAVLEDNGDWNYEYVIFVDIEFYKEMFSKMCNSFVPASRKLALKSLDKYETVKINVDSVKHVSEVQAKLKELGYKTSSLQSAIEPIQKTSNMLQLVLGCIGGVSMLVSAISIANTMIMSIYERTKEIGVMKVLGCYVKDVKKLFLFESAMIGMIGGLLGIGCSYAASWAINKYGTPIFQSLLQHNGMYDMSSGKFSIVPLWLPAAALLFAMFIGVISGYYPARRATRISAIEAMKTES